MKLDELISGISAEDKELIGRAVNTLYGNIIKTDSSENNVFGNKRGIMPSPSTYKGVWNWDSAFHLIAMSYLDKEIAHEQAEIMFDHQLPDGMLPDVCYINGKVVTRFTKPPVYAMAIMYGDMISPDTAFLARCYEPLKRNLMWWETNRMKGGLFHYKVSGMESGWDDSIRFKFPNYPSWTYYIDLNSYMVTFYKAMSYITAKLDEFESAEIYNKKAKELSQRINERLFDTEQGIYGDYNYVLHKFTRILTPAVFMPLYIGIADNERAENLTKVLLDSKYFYPYVPTLSYDNRRCKPDGYWNGPCWLNTAYFAIKGLYNYGHKEEALTMTDAVLRMCSDNKDHIYERYDSVTGKGLGAKDFGWSAVFIIELVLLKYGKNII